ncbi:hypothetical protein K469DRAFT_699754, partial [Zopfia rhizophila CBS 207.26]
MQAGTLTSHRRALHLRTLQWELRRLQLVAPVRPQTETPRQAHSTQGSFPAQAVVILFLCSLPLVAVAFPSFTSSSGTGLPSLSYSFCYSYLFPCPRCCIQRLHHHAGSSPPADRPAFA